MHFLIILGMYSMQCIPSIEKHYFILTYPFIKIFGFIKLINIYIYYSIIIT